MQKLKPLLCHQRNRNKNITIGFEENVAYEQLNIEQLKEERDKNKESKNQIGSLKALIGDIPKELQNIEIVDVKIENLDTELESIMKEKHHWMIGDKRLNKIKRVLKLRKVY